jgi:hypothetical protein
MSISYFVLVLDLGLYLRRFATTSEESPRSCVAGRILRHLQNASGKAFTAVPR